MRFVQIKFNPWDRKTYTYTYDGDAPLEPGDKVEVNSAKEGVVEVEVDGVSDVRPAAIPAHIELKPLLRVLGAFVLAIALGACRYGDICVDQTGVHRCPVVDDFGPDPQP